MGVSAGWRDLYHRDLSYQWVYVSETQPGNYWVAAEIDTNNVVQEANEANNTRTFAAGQTAVPGYLAQAVNAGTLPFGQASTVTLASQTFGSPGARRFRIRSLPAHGTLKDGATTLAVGSVVTGPGITYTPAAGYSGPDAFDFSALSSTSAFPRNPATATVSLTVGDAPVGTQVQISGAPTSMNMGTSVQLTATVTNGTGGVTWSVNGVNGGNATVGTITAAGLYQAPAAVPSPAAVTIRATSVSTPTAFDQKSITILDPGPPDPAPNPPGNVVINPSFETNTGGWTTWQAGLTRVQLGDAPERRLGRPRRPHGGDVLHPRRLPGVGALGRRRYPVHGPRVRQGGEHEPVGKRVRIFLREGTATAYIRTISGPSVVLTNSFQEITGQITAQAAGRELEVIIGMESGAVAGDAFYADQITFSNGTTPPPPVNNPPTASFTASTTTPAIGQPVTYTDTSLDGDGNIASRAWDTDGDGQYDDGTGATATATYAAAGPVTVGLRVTDDDQRPGDRHQGDHRPEHDAAAQHAAHRLVHGEQPDAAGGRGRDLHRHLHRPRRQHRLARLGPRRRRPVRRRHHGDDHPRLRDPGPVVVGLRVVDNGGAPWHDDLHRHGPGDLAPAPARQPRPERQLRDEHGQLDDLPGLPGPRGADRGPRRRLRRPGHADHRHVLHDRRLPRDRLERRGDGAIRRPRLAPRLQRVLGGQGRPDPHLREATPGPTGRSLRTVNGAGLALTTSWQEITGQMTVGTAGNEIDMFVGVGSGGVAGDVFYIDKVSLSAP